MNVNEKKGCAQIRGEGMSANGVYSIVLLCHFGRSFLTIVVCIMKFEFMSCSVIVPGFVLILLFYLVMLNVVCVLSLGVCLYSGCDGCCVFV